MASMVSRDITESWSLPSRLAVNSAPASSGTLRSFTVLQVGVTGRGKTTFCNFLSHGKQHGTVTGIDAMDPDFSTSEPQAVKVAVKHSTIQSLTVIDTPGHLSESLLSADGHILKVTEDSTTLRHYRHALILARDGIHAILVVLQAGTRVGAQEELKMVELISALDLWKRCIVVFTHGNSLGSNDDERYDNIHRKLDNGKMLPVIQKIMKFVNKRFIIVESVDKQANPEKYYNSKLEELVCDVESVYERCGLFATDEFRLAQESWRSACLEQSLVEKDKQLKKRKTDVHDLEKALKLKDEEVQVLRFALRNLEEKLFALQRRDEQQQHQQLERAQELLQQQQQQGAQLQIQHSPGQPPQQQQGQQQPPQQQQGQQQPPQQQQGQQQPPQEQQGQQQPNRNWSCTIL